MISLSSLPFYNLDDDQFRQTLYEFMNGGTINFDPDRLAQLKFNPLLCESCKNFSLCKDNDPVMNFYWIMCILCTPRPTYRSTYRPTVDRRIGRHIGRVSTDMSVDTSVDCRPICRPRCVARYIGRHIGRASVDMSTVTRPICRSICRPRVVVRLSADMSIDRLPTFRRYFTATCVLVIVSNFCSADILDLLPASQRLLCI